MTCEELLKSLTAKQRVALDTALRNGAVFAGKSENKGHASSVAATTVMALKRRGLLDIQIGPNGGLTGRPTDLAKISQGPVAYVLA
jgi:hypothetical protein